MYGKRDIPLTREVMKPFLIIEVLVTGHYDRKTKKLQSVRLRVGEGFSYETTPRFNPKVDVNTDFSDAIQDIDYVKIQLRDIQNNILYETRTPGNDYVELFYESQPIVLKWDKIPINVKLPLYSKKGFFKVRISKGVLSNDSTGKLIDVEDKNSIQEIKFKWPNK